MSHYRVVLDEPYDMIAVNRMGPYYCGYRTGSSIAILHPCSGGWGFVYAEDIVKAHTSPGSTYSGKFKACTKAECIQNALKAGRKLIASESVREVMRVLINQFPEGVED